jgi:hypothetical protein
MEIGTLLSLLIGAFSLYIAYRMYHHSYGGTDFKLSEENIDKLNSTRKRDTFSGLEDIDFYFINKSAKPLVIEKIVIEKAVHPVSLKGKSNPLTTNFFILYHYYVSEKSFKGDLKIVYGSKTATVGTRKYNLIKSHLTISPSEKKTFKFTKEQQFRELFYTFEGRLNAFSIVNIYAKDTMGNKLELSKKGKKAFTKASRMDADIVSVFLNRFASKKLTLGYLYLLSENHKEVAKDTNHSSRAIASYLQNEEDDLNDDISIDLMQLDEGASEMIKKDNRIIEESLEQPLKPENMGMALLAWNEEISLSDLRKMTIDETKKFREENADLVK